MDFAITRATIAIPHMEKSVKKCKITDGAHLNARLALVPVEGGLARIGTPPLQIQAAVAANRHIAFLKGIDASDLKIHFLLPSAHGSQQSR